MTQRDKILIVLLATLVTGSSPVFGHGGDTSKIHACVNSRNGELRIVGANESCKIFETALDWSLAPSISTRTVSNLITMPGDVVQPASVSVSCAANEWLTGGGFDQAQATEFDATPLDIDRSNPSIEGTGLANGWTVRARNRTNRDQTLRVFALCASSAP